MTMDHDVTPAGLAIDCGGRAVRLKWHKLRRERADLPFLRDNLARGLALGASMEVDLRQLACGRFVCLHDQRLERETSGSGPVRRIDGDAVASLRLREPKTGVLGEPPMVLDELVGRVAQASETLAPETTIQLDLKERAEAITGATARSFADLIGPVAGHFLLSSDDWEATRRLGEGATGLALGYELNHLAKDWDFSSRDKIKELAFAVAAEAPEAKIIYLARDVLSAGLAQGVNLIADLRAYGYEVDCWTIDADARDGADQIRTAVQAGADQITTNTPLALEALWRNLQSPATAVAGTGR
jgi:glycerophosphoryl diester phosphodiesterase